MHPPTGSHKAMFARPHSLFGSFGGSNRGSAEHSYGALSEGEEPIDFSTDTPPGLLNICPDAGEKKPFGVHFLIKRPVNFCQDWLGTTSMRETEKRRDCCFL